MHKLGEAATGLENANVWLDGNPAVHTGCTDLAEASVDLLGLLVSIEGPVQERLVNAKSSMRPLPLRSPHVGEWRSRVGRHRQLSSPT